MSTRPRNPRYYPTMKVRGARRHRMARMQRTARSFDLLGRAMANAATQFKSVVTALQGFRYPENLARKPQEPISAPNSPPGSLSDTHDGTHPHNTKGDDQ